VAVTGASRKQVRAADLRPGVAARDDSGSYGLVTDVSPSGEGSSTWRVQLSFFVDADHEFDALLPEVEEDSW
jgi:hypothetical protein